MNEVDSPDEDLALLRHNSARTAAVELFVEIAEGRSECRKVAWR